MRKRKSITRVLFDEARDYFQKYSNDETRKAYIKNYKKYIQFCRESFDSRSKEDCALYVQKYSDVLLEKGYTASTIHSYLACVCNYHNINMSEIKKPIRHTSEFSRGRGNYKNSNLSGDFDNPRFKKIVRFQSLCGVRRAELKRLKKSDFVYDESGFPCIKITRGKGGKMQLQRIIGTDDEIAFIKSCFDVENPNDYVFERTELANKLNFHYLRAKNAQRAYKYYVNRINTEGEAYIKELEKQIIDRWTMYNIDKKTGKPKHFNRNLIEGKYYLRGKNREFAVKNGLAVEYSKLALFAVNVLHLSHWRNDVGVESYMLVV